jgi:hypothetical protein
MNLYHYTNLDSAIKIIGANGLCFHGSRYDSMNDPTDFIYARDVIIPLLQEKGIEAENGLFPYIVSFCKNEDDFLMWRLYNSNVALVVESETFPKILDKEEEISETIVHGDVHYAVKDEIVDVCERLVANPKIEFINDPQANFYFNCIPFIKNTSYKEENEYRMVRYDYIQMHFSKDPNEKDGIKITEKEIPNGVFVRDVKDNDIRLYSNFNLPKEALKGIIFNTHDDALFEKQEEHMKVLLESYGYDSDKIEITKTKSFIVKQ